MSCCLQQYKVVAPTFVRLNLQETTALPVIPQRQCTLSSEQATGKAMFAKLCTLHVNSRRVYCVARFHGPVAVTDGSLQRMLHAIGRPHFSIHEKSHRVATTSRRSQSTNEKCTPWLAQGRPKGRAKAVKSQQDLKAEGGGL